MAHFLKIKNICHNKGSLVCSPQNCCFLMPGERDLNYLFFGWGILNEMLSRAVETRISPPLVESDNGVLDRGTISSPN